MNKPSAKAGANFEKNTTADILNAVAADDQTPSRLADALPEVQAGNIETLHAYGNIINNNPNLQNDFANVLINRMALTLIKSKAFYNPYAMFKRGYLELGDVIEEIYVDIIDPHRYNPQVAESQFMKREMPKILASYYKMNSQAYYKVTVSSQDLTRAFVNWNGITDLIGRIVGRLVDSMEYDEFMMIKYMMARHILAGHFTPVVVPGTSDGDIESIKGISMGMVFDNRDYNPAGVLTHTTYTEQYLFMSASAAAKYDVEVLAKAFNMDKVQFLGHQVIYDNITKFDDKRMQELLFDYIPLTEDEQNWLSGVTGFIVDIEALLIFDELLEARQQENGEGLYWNHWLHAWKTLKMSPYANQVVFVKTEGTVTSVTVNPATVTGFKNKSVSFSADVAGTGIYNSRVQWSVDSTLSTISSDGVLKIANNETASSLTVTATSTEAATISGTAAVKVYGND